MATNQNPTPAQRLARALSDPAKFTAWDVDALPHLQSDDLPDPTDTGVIDLGEIGAPRLDRLDVRELANDAKNVASALGVARLAADMMGTPEGTALAAHLLTQQKRSLALRDALRALDGAL